MPTLPAFGALHGLKVIDASRVLAGPQAAQMLGDHGADVIKIEPPFGDDTRKWGPPYHRGTGAYFYGANRNKRAMSIDMNTEAGREVFLRLLDDADVLLENFKSGTMEKWGIGYDKLKEKFPRLIHCQITGFGNDGPMGGYPGYDAVAQAFSGVMSINGSPESGTMRVGAPIVDMAAGFMAIIGILAALYERQTSGKGQFIESTLYDTGIALLHPHAIDYFIGGHEPVLLGSAHPNIVPYDKFITRTGEIFLGTGVNRQFIKFCEFMGSPELAHDERFATSHDRMAYRVELTKILTETLAGVDGHALCEDLLKIGVPCGPVQTVPEVFEHPHTAHREMLVEADGVKMAGVPIKLSRTPGRIENGCPDFGTHTREIMREYGYSDKDIEAMLEAGTILEQAGEYK